MLKISEGNYISLCTEGNALVDGRFVVHSPTDKSFLFVLQMKHSRKKQVLTYDKVKEFYNGISTYVVPKYTKFEVIPVLITNRTFSQGIIII